MADLLIALNFPDHFIKCVMQCIKSPRFTSMLNGSIKEFIPARRGFEAGRPNFSTPLCLMHGLFVQDNDLHKYDGYVQALYWLQLTQIKSYVLCK